MSRDAPLSKRRKLESNAIARPTNTTSRIFAPFRTIGLVSPTAVPFTAVPIGKTTFQITTSVGRSLQTYDLRKGLNTIFITRPQTPGPITATVAHGDLVSAAWADEKSNGSHGIWIFKRGQKIAELEMSSRIERTIVQLLFYGAWIIGCGSKAIEVWKSDTYEHYTTLLPAIPGGESNKDLLTGGICIMPTYTNKILAGRGDGSVEIWNVSTGRLLHTIEPPSSDVGAITALEPTPAISLLAIAYMNRQVVIHDIHSDTPVMRVNASGSEESPITSISFRTDDLGAGDDGRKPGVMATASFNGADVTIWDLNKGGRKMGVLRGAHKAPSQVSRELDGGISKIEFLSGQPVLLTSGHDNSLKSWIFDEVPFSPIPRILHARGGHSLPLTTLNFLPTDSEGAEAEGKWLVSSSRDQTLWGWSIRRDGQSTEISQGQIQKKAKKLAGSHNGLVLDSSDGTDSLRAPEITCMACSLNRDGGRGAMPGVKTIWTSATKNSGKNSDTAKSFSGWESVLTGHKGDKFARTWFWGRKRAGRWILPTSDGEVVKSVAVSPCGNFALVGSAGGAIDMYNLQSGYHRQRFPPKLTPTQAKRLQVEVANLAAQEHDAKWKKGQGKHAKAVTGIFVDSLNRFVVSCGLDGKVKFWDFMTGVLEKEIDWHLTTAITSMDFHRPSNLIALSCNDSRIRVVDFETQKVVRDLSGCKGSINDFCFSNDGRWIIAASSDSVIRVWDLPTGHLIDAIRLSSPCTALTFSNNGEFLATSQEGSVGVDLWSNKTLFTHLPTRHISEDEIATVTGPTTSGEGGQNILGSEIEGEIEMAPIDEEAFVDSMEQLNEEVTTLSLVPKSRWQTLLHLDAIRERNKPKEAPKAPEKAPFFLPSLLQKKIDDTSSSNLQNGSDIYIPETQSSRVVKMNREANEDLFTKLLRQGDESAVFTNFTEHLKTLNPASADIQIRSLSVAAPFTELVAFVTALTQRLQLKRDYELVQAWMAVFLKCHGEVVYESEALVDALKEWRQHQKKEADRLHGLVGYCSGVVGFLRSGRT